MEKYIAQLIEDLQAAESVSINPMYLELDDEMECLRGSIEYLEGPSITFEQAFEIEKARFPPPEKLTPAQMQNIADAILSLWQAHNFYADIPKGLPVNLVYVLLVDKWNEEVQYVSRGEVHFDWLCYGDEQCKIKDWCKGKWCGWEG
jgi:hypothetical protein